MANMRDDLNKQSRLRLYHSQPTGNSYKVRLLLSILRIPYEAVDVDIFDGGNHTPEYRQINPLGKAPALELEDGTILTESNAILVYLATGTTYFSEERLPRAQILRWMFFEQYSHLPYIGVARYQLHLLKKNPPPDSLRLWHERGYLALDIMDRHLAMRQWFVGDSISIADVALYAYTHVAHEGGFELSGYGRIRAWMADIESAPNYIPLDRRPDLVGGP